MSWKTNFYFYFSVFSLIFIGVLIYYFYKVEFDYSLSINTLLTVFGTVFGAYFGAKIAGNHATNIAKQQLEQQYNKEQQEFHKNKIKYLFRIYTKLKTGLEASKIFKKQFEYYFSNKSFFSEVILNLSVEEIKEIEYILKNTESIFLDINDIGEIHNLYVSLNTIQKLSILGVNLINYDRNLSSGSITGDAMLHQNEIKKEYDAIIYNFDKSLLVYEKLFSKFDEK